MTSNLTKYNSLWLAPNTNDSASFDSYTITDYFVPSGTATVSGTSLYTTFPSQSFTRIYEPFNINKIAIEEFTVASYTISHSVDSAIYSIAIQFYPYISFFPGRVDTVTFGLPYEVDFFLSYSLDWKLHSWPNKQPYLRTGLYINENSPHINIQTTTASISLDKYIVGDFFYSASDGYYINYDSAPRKLVTARISENLGRYTTIENPYNAIIDLNSVVTDNFYQTTVGTQSLISGALWKNNNWLGGVFMTDSGTVSIYGDQQKFSVSSGSFIVSSSVTSSHITFNRTSTSWSLNSAPTDITRVALEFRDSNVLIPSYVALTGITSSLLIIGESASVEINKLPVTIAIMQSGSVSLTPTTNGEIRIYSASGVSGSNVGYIYTSGSWHTILTGSDFYPTMSNGIY